MEPTSLQYARPDNTPLVVCYSYAIASFVPYLLTSWLLFKRKRRFEAVASAMVVYLGVTQGILEMHDKDYVWDNAANYQPELTAGTNGHLTMSFTWRQLTAYTWGGLDFIQWQKLLMQCWTTLSCMLLVMTMQNLNREVDRTYMALFTMSIMILFEIAHQQDQPLSRFAALSIISAFILALLKGADCRRRGNKRIIDQHQFLKAVIFFVVSMVSYAFRYGDELRKNMLIRPFFGFSVLCAGAGSFYLVRAFITKAMEHERSFAREANENNVVLT